MDVYFVRGKPGVSTTRFADDQVTVDQGHAMTNRTLLKVIFSAIFLIMLVYTSWASFQQPVMQWRGMTAGPDRYWTIATMLDAYFGFITFYVWVCFKEARWPLRVAWFVAIMLLGNMAMSAYVLLQLLRLRPDQHVSCILFPAANQQRKPPARP
jgi:hypothetical protein